MALALLHELVRRDIAGGVASGAYHSSNTSTVTGHVADDESDTDTESVTADNLGYSAPSAPSIFSSRIPHTTTECGYPPNCSKNIS